MKELEKLYWEYDEKDGKDLHKLIQHQNMAISEAIQTIKNVRTNKRG